MMTSRILFFATWLLLATGLMAQNDQLLGTWSVAGQNPQGVAYEGEMEIEPVSSNLYTLNWAVTYGEDESLTFPGTALYDTEGNVMFAAYGIGNLRYGLCVYPLNDKGGLAGEGDWTSHNGIGNELLAGKLNRSRITGTYDVVGTRSEGDVALGAAETYSGTLKISKQDDLYRLEWFLGDGMPYTGVAYKAGDNLVGVWGIGKSYGLERYQFSDDMQSAQSTWISPNNGLNQVGQETLTRE